MSKTITFNVPVRRRVRPRKFAHETATRNGRVVWLNVGPHRVKFVLQLNNEGEPAELVHYASGQIFGSLNGPKLLHAVHRGTYTRLSDRAAAESLIARKVASMGADAIMNVLNAAPVLNT